MTFNQSEGRQKDKCCVLVSLFNVYLWSKVAYNIIPWRPQSILSIYLFKRSTWFWCFIHFNTFYTWSSRKGRDGRVPCANSKHKQAFSCWRTFIVLLLSWSSWLDHGIEKIYDNVLLKGNNLHMNKRGMSLKSNDFSEKNHEFIVVCLIWICLGVMANVYTTV